MNKKEKILSAVLFSLFVLFSSCGERERVTINGLDGSDGKNCTLEKTRDEKVLLVCGDTVFDISELEGEDGSDGLDGLDGKDGEDAVILSTQTIPAKSCTQVDSNTWVQNHDKGRQFDVYENDQCKDKLGEHCDNVSTSRSNEPFGDGKNGASKVCWVNNVQYSGALNDDGTIKLYRLEFQR